MKKWERTVITFFGKVSTVGRDTAMDGTSHPREWYEIEEESVFEMMIMMKRF